MGYLHPSSRQQRTAPPLPETLWLPPPDLALSRPARYGHKESDHAGPEHID